MLTPIRLLVMAATLLVSGMWLVGFISTGEDNFPLVFAGLGLAGLGMVLRRMARSTDQIGGRS